MYFIKRKKSKLSSFAYLVTISRYGPPHLPYMFSYHARSLDLIETVDVYCTTVVTHSSGRVGMIVIRVYTTKTYLCRLLLFPRGILHHLLPVLNSPISLHAKRYHSRERQVPEIG